MTDPHPDIRPLVSASDIRQYIVAAVARELEINPELVHADQPLLSYGLDSMQFIGLIGELEQWLHCRILANPLAHFPTADQLANWIAAELAAGHTQLHPAPQHELGH